MMASKISETDESGLLLSTAEKLLRRGLDVKWSTHVIRR
ncbi:unnamed protein product [Amoebophrya sp. A25]|nr:unnamed protein product [Amoebophrya sp. A25]|eukprot:GSA25T00018829001.1